MRTASAPPHLHHQHSSLHPHPSILPLPSILHLLLVLLLLPSFVSPQSGYVQVGYSWTQQFPQLTSPSLWPGRYGSSAAITSAGNIVLLGGLAIPFNTSSPSTPFTLYNDVQMTSTVGTTFVGTVTAAFTPRFFHSSALTSAGSILLIGGFTLTSADPSTISSLRDTWYSSDGLKWSVGSQMPWTRGRGGHDVDADTTSLIFYVSCGYSQDPGQAKTTLNDIWKTPDAGNTWQVATTAAPFTSRAFHAGMVRQGALFIVGGATYVSGYGWAACNDVWVSYDQGTTWGVQVSSTPYTFLNRFLQSSLSYNNDDLFWMAGISISRGFNLLNPLAGAGMANSSVVVYSDVWESTDAGQSWQQTNPTSVFGPRFSAAVVILGQDLVLMGGVNGSATGELLQDAWMTVLPLDATSSSGVVVAAIVGTLSGILMLVVVVIRRMQDKFTKGAILVSGKTEAELLQEQQKA